MRKKILLSAALIAVSFTSFAQVGVGTTSPSAALDVVSTGSDDTTKALEINNATGELVTVLDNGQVGIGTATPTYIFEVNNADGNANLATVSEIGNSSLITSAPVGSRAIVSFKKDYINRFLIESVGTDETGSNEGSNLLFRRYSDTGAFLGTELAIDRAEGNVGVGTDDPEHNLHVYGKPGSAAQIRLQSQGGNGELSIDAPTAFRSVLSFKKSEMNRFIIESVNSAETGSNVGSDLYFRRYSDTGTFLGTAMCIVRSTGNVGINTLTPGSKLSVKGLVLYADNAAATAAGLVAGDFYRTADGTVKVVY